MATIAPTALVGGGVASSSQSGAPIKVTSEAFRETLIAIHKAISSGAPFDKFVEEFLAPENNAILPPPAHDLDFNHPLTAYFISSSHNTYLVEHQLYGKSTVQGYINVLSRGCRCVEIDVWDGEDGEPKVDHGWTLTEAITFQEVCEAIAKYAFLSSDLPVIVSLECHASMEQQAKMVTIMKNSWKEMLMEGELSGWNVADKGLPPPGLLRNKILVKVKYLPPDAQPGGPSGPAVQSLVTKTKSLTVADDEDSETDPEVKKKAPKVKISATLSALGVYASAMKFAESFTDAVSTRPNHVFSFSEKKFNALHEAQADALFQHNRHFLTRVYPHGLRISSSNLNPQDFWRRGAQLVALNWQKADKGITFNEAMFAGTGGYVLKPQSHLPDPKNCVGIKDLQKDVDLKVTILAGQSLPLPKDHKAKDFQPYVKVIVHVSQNIKQKEKVKHGKGQNVRWEKKNTLQFKVAEVVEQLAFVKFKVYNDEFGKDEKSAWACVRMDRLKKGYGHLKLFDMKGNATDAALIIYVEKS
ncbi:hypothetical protein TWF694_011220 [Orbilia ellipsospora]|uniref:Phosphoinositide phospholipase C n=1 Tax=Orbilia ellipsospora TaxID=2528407 RepID=A0AAV9X9S0_9PEZI